MVGMMKVVKTLLLPIGCLNRCRTHNVWTKLVLTALLFVAVFLPGPDRLVNGQRSWLEKRVSSAGMKRRYWNDELEPCIVKYCLKDQHQRIKYMRCVHRFCPAGLVTVPRELQGGEGQYPLTGDHAPTLDDVMKVCAALKCDDVTYDLQASLCSSMKCDDIMPRERDVDDVSKSDLMSSLLPESPAMSSHSSQQRSEMMRYSLLNLCGELNCPSLRGAEFIDCMALHCYPEPPSERSNEPQMETADANANSVDQSEPGLMRKRRVNAINAQCIQSQCGSKSGTARKICMINFCHGR